MSYCIGLKIAEGLVFLSDTRTNAGVDHISRYRKMFTWEIERERAIALMTAGNLSIGQGVVTRLNRAIQVSKHEDVECILNTDSLFRVAEIVGETMQEMQSLHRDDLEAQGATADASIILRVRPALRTMLFAASALSSASFLTSSATLRRLSSLSSFCLVKSRSDGGHTRWIT